MLSELLNKVFTCLLASSTLCFSMVFFTDRHALLHSTLRSTFSSPPPPPPTSGESVEMSDVKGKEATISEKPAKKKPVKVSIHFI